MAREESGSAPFIDTISMSMFRSLSSPVRLHPQVSIKSFVVVSCGDRDPVSPHAAIAIHDYIGIDAIGGGRSSRRPADQLRDLVPAKATC